MLNFQRRGAENNTQVGNDFETLVAELLVGEFPNLKKNFSVKLGIQTKKSHKFDFGSQEDKIVIECKAHTWTESNKIPSAKMTTWDQALYYFYLAPDDFKKIFIVRKDVNHRTGETLCNYYLRTHNHLIPNNVEFRELDENARELKKIYPR